MEYYSVIKKNAICNNMDGPREYYTNWIHSEKNIIW